MRIIFSKDRPAQLDLLLRSLERYAPDEDTVVLYHGSIGSHRAADFDLAYRYASEDHPDSRWAREQDFDTDFRGALNFGDESVSFFCDDDVLFRETRWDPGAFPLQDPAILCHSWRLGPFNGSYDWRWTDLPRTGHGYPGSIDGHTFRTSDVQEMIAGQVIENPTMLETVLALGCEKFAGRRPLMAAWPDQVLVGVPVNRVSETSGCPNGERFPQPVEELNRRFLAGERIALDRLDFSGVDGCHHEIQYEWE